MHFGADRRQRLVLPALSEGRRGVTSAASLLNWMLTLMAASGSFGSAAPRSLLKWTLTLTAASGPLGWVALTSLLNGMPTLMGASGFFGLTALRFLLLGPPESGADRIGIACVDAEVMAGPMVHHTRCCEHDWLYQRGVVLFLPEVYELIVTLRCFPCMAILQPGFLITLQSRHQL